MHPAKIKAELEIAGVTQGEIAAELEPPVSDTAVSLVIKKKSISDRIMKMISSKIGKHPWEVFPEYYLKKQKRKTLKTVAH